MKQNSDSNEGNAPEIQAMKDLDADSLEILNAVNQKEEDSSGNQAEGYRIWHYNGVPVGVRFHKDKS